MKKYYVDNEGAISEQQQWPDSPAVYIASEVEGFMPAIQWFSASDSLPQTDEIVIVCTTGADVEPAFFTGSLFVSVDPTCDPGEELDVVYWMKLPPAPVTTGRASDSASPGK